MKAIVAAFGAVVLGFVGAAAQAEGSPSEQQAARIINTAQAGLLARVADDLEFAVTRADFTSSISDISPRGGGYMVDIAAIVDHAVICKGKVVVSEEFVVTEVIPALTATSFCGDIR